MAFLCQYMVSLTATSLEIVYHYFTRNKRKLDYSNYMSTTQLEDPLPAKQFKYNSETSPYFDVKYKYAGVTFYSKQGNFNIQMLKKKKALTSEANNIQDSYMDVCFFL